MLSLQEEKKIVVENNIFPPIRLKSPVLQQKRKIIHPLLSSTGVVPLPNIFNRNSNRIANNNVNTEKVLTFKERKIRQLETRLADINLQINELSKENSLLKSIQKRHEYTLKRYEDANHEIPKLIDSHTEEMRSWQVRHNQLKLRFRDIVERTKVKDEEILSLTRDHDNLLKQTNEANIERRVSLKKEITELTERCLEEQEMINTLQRRIILQEKNHRYRIKQNRHKSLENRSKFQN